MELTLPGSQPRPLLRATARAVVKIGTGVGLPAGHEEILEYPYQDTFSCEGRAYGYYADVQSGCQVREE